VLKIRDQGSVRNKHAYLAIGVGIDGMKETLGIWLELNEGAKFWLRVISELKARGVEDILVFSVDGLKGFPEAIEAVYPQAIVQTCIVHMIRNSLRFTSYKDRKQLVKDLRMIYTAATEEAAESGLETFAGIWDSRYPQISQSWRDAWERVIPYFAFPPALRRAVYTTNQIESLNSVVRKAVRSRGHFPDDESARKLVYLAIRNHESNWKRPMAGWYECLAAFHAHFRVATAPVRVGGFPGYYSFDTVKGGKTYGMLSVNAATSAIWYHGRRGSFLADRDFTA
jgi:putative transposase